jgi:hypothetical protein
LRRAWIFEGSGKRSLSGLLIFTASVSIAVMHDTLCHKAPAFRRIPVGEARRLDSVPALDEAFSDIGCRPVYVFDFDGVLASVVEERVYQLPTAHGERERLEQVAARLGLDPSLYDTAYLRHLVFQEAMASAGWVPEPGPLCAAARALSEAGRPFFVLTARSGVAAIQRALAFMAAERIHPQEFFCVGRVAKGRQLARIDTDTGERPFVFFDDSEMHSGRSARQKTGTALSVHVDWGDPDWAAAGAIYERAMGVFNVKAAA